MFEVQFLPTEYNSQVFGKLQEKAMVFYQVGQMSNKTTHGVIVICNSNRLLHGFRIIVIDEANHGCNSNSNSNTKKGNR